MPAAVPARQAQNTKFWRGERQMRRVLRRIWVPVLTAGRILHETLAEVREVIPAGPRRPARWPAGWGSQASRAAI
jgi:hypothetical protein